MPIARTVADVVAGEATFQGGDENRYADMLGIASVIANRAVALGVTPQQVVSVQSQFNAYGKMMPPGAARYREMAQKALADVEQNGPVHNGTFFATPKAAANLPSGLQQVDTVEGGHNFYSDPKARAIKTAVGAKLPDVQALNQHIQTKIEGSMALADVPVPEARPVTAYAPEQVAAEDPFSAVMPTSFDASRFGDEAATAQGMAGLDQGLRMQQTQMNADRALAESQLASQFDASRFGDKQGGVVGQDGLAHALAAQKAALAGPQISVDASGLLGSAPDLSAAARAVPDSASSFDMGRMGLSEPGFDAGRFGPEQGIDTSGFDASRFGADPDINGAMSQAIAASVTNSPSEAAPSVAQNGISANDLAANYAAYGAGKITPEQQAAQDFNNEVMSTKTRRLVASDDPALAAQQPVSVQDTTITSQTPVTSQAVQPTQNMPTPDAALAAATASRAAAQVQAGARASDVWSGLATTGTATDGSTVTRLDDGTVARYNPKFDHTEYTNPDGTWGGLKKGNLLTAPAQPTSTTANTAKASLTGAPTQQTKSNFGAGTWGGLAGALAGTAIAGPIGGLALGVLGHKLAEKNLGDQQPDKGLFGSLLSMFTGPRVSVDANGFPTAPTSQGQASPGLNAYGKSVYGDSNQFSGAVDSGTGGLW